MNIKTVKPKGVFHIFRKSVVEVTAAIDDKVTLENSKEKEQAQIAKNVPVKPVAAEPPVQITRNIEKREVSAIEQKLDMLADMIEKQQEEEKAEKLFFETLPAENEQEVKIEPEKESMHNKMQTLLMNQLLNNEVDEKYAELLVQELENVPLKQDAIDTILANVYQRIVLKLGQPEVIEIAENKGPKVCFFVGSTGVGKTTTIAKIASMYKLEKKAKVALVTSDTYRIAAVEQLKTYANILSLPIRVVYTPEEMQNAVEDYWDYDLIIVDTAGRSHKNTEQCDELRKLIDSVDKELREVYLVLSATTKYKDMKHITKTYSDIEDYRLIFTKLDETSCYGNILNIRMDTKAPLSYVTCGQVVPDDIETINAQMIAKQLIGGCE